MAIRRVSKLSQFKALLHKNVLLQTRNRKSPFGLAGWGAFVFQLCVPALFFAVMFLPKYYIPPVPHLQQLSSRSLDLDVAWWSGPQPYSGPALDPQFQGAAHILLAPDTPAVAALVPVLARALACAPDPSKYACLPGRPTNFYCLFSNTTTMHEKCKVQATCMVDESCYGHLLESSGGRPAQIAVMRDEAAAVERAMQRPADIDAVLVFDRARGGPAEAGRGGWGSGSAGRGQDRGSGKGSSLQAASVGSEGGRVVEVVDGLKGSDERTAAGGAPPLLAHSLLDYRIRVNHTDIPPTEFLYDMFDVVPDPFRQNGLMLYKRHWFFTNLQLALERSIIGLRRAELAPQPQPSPPSPSPAPPPTPSPSPAPAPTPSPSPLSEPSPPPSPSLPPSHQRLLSVAGKVASSSMTRVGNLQLASSSSSSNANPADVRVSFKPFPWPAVTEDLGAASAGVLFNLLLVFAFLAPARAVVGAIVREKELRLREGMRIMGLGEMGYWGSWFLTHWVSLCMSGILCVLVGMYPFAHTSVAVMLLFFALFTASLVCFSYFLSTLFSTSRIAGTTAQLLYAVAMLPGFLAPAIDPYGGPALYWACLTPPSAASLFAGCLINWELISKGINWTTLWLPVTPNSSWSAGSVLWLLMLDIFMYAFLAWYCDKVLPTGHGHTLPPLFFLDKRYWDQGGGGNGRDRCKPSTGHAVTIPADGSAGPDASALVPVGGGATTVVGGAEAAGGQARGAVSVQRLRKEFYTTQGDIKVALDDLDVDFAGGRITALLGHNGAGKTTLIHILTGLTPPTSGNALLNGFDVRTEMGRIRESLGICPQHDVLWPDLTVREHLQLYAAIKGYKGVDVDQVAQEAGEQVGLAAKLDSQAGDLSGGQKRKLSVAIAFLGDPAVVLIDEPTSGMDPYTRRFTWELIRRYRGRAAVVLTTHSMEEADVLGDDVVIMGAGRVAAHGTPMELKAAHGEGYTLTLSLCSPPPPPTPSNSYNQLSAAAAPGAPPQLLQSGMGMGSEAAAGRMEALEALVQRHVPAAQLLRCTGCGRAGDNSGAAVSTGRSSGEMVFQLPRFDAPLFPPLLRELDAAVGATAAAAEAGHSSAALPVQGSRPAGTGLSRPGSRQDVSEAGEGLGAAELEGLGVGSYGLSVTTLEEVFLKVTEETTDYGVQGEVEAEMGFVSSRSAREHAAAGVGAGAGGGVAGQGTGAGVTPAAGKREEWEGGAGEQRQPLLQPSAACAVQQGRPQAAQVAGGPSRVEEGQGGAQAEAVTGGMLLKQQLRALLTKRALCAARGRLTLLTQLVVPLLLVYLSLWVTSLSVKSADKAAVPLTRATVLQGQPSVLSAVPEVRGAVDGRMAAWMHAHSQVFDSRCSKLYQGGSLEGTLDDWLLSHWYGISNTTRAACEPAATSTNTAPWAAPPSQDAQSVKDNSTSVQDGSSSGSSGGSGSRGGSSGSNGSGSGDGYVAMEEQRSAPSPTLVPGLQKPQAQPPLSAGTSTHAAARTPPRALRMLPGSGAAGAAAGSPGVAAHVRPGAGGWGLGVHPAPTHIAGVAGQEGHMRGPANDAVHVTALPSLQEWLQGGSSEAFADMLATGRQDGASGSRGIVGRRSSSSSSSSSSNNNGTSSPHNPFAVNSNSATASLTIMVNQTAVWGMPAAISGASTGLLRYLEAAAATAAGPAAALAGGGLGAADVSFKVTNHPLPVLPFEASARVRQDASALLLVVCLTLAASVLSASFCVFLVRERASGSTHLQLVAGTPSWLYWASNLGWDLVQYSISATGIVLLVVWYDLPQYSGPRLPVVVALLAGLGISSLPLTYLMQRSFMDEMKALQRLNTIFFLVGYLGFVAVWIMDLVLIFTKPATLQTANAWIKTVFRLLSPHFCFAKGVFDVSQTYTSTMPLPIPRETDPWAYTVSGSPLMHMALQAAVYFSLVVLLDSGLTTWARTLMSRQLLAHMRHRQAQAPTLGSRHGGGDEGGEGMMQPLLAPEAAEAGTTAIPARSDSVPGMMVNGSLSDGGVSAPLQQPEGGDSEEDVDVRAERLAVQRGVCDASGAVVVVDGAKKTYYMGTAGWRALLSRFAARMTSRAAQLSGSRRQPGGAHAGAGTAPGSGSGGGIGVGGRSQGSERAAAVGATELSAEPGSSSWAVDVGAGHPDVQDGWGCGARDGGGHHGTNTRRQAVQERGGSMSSSGGGTGGEDVVRALRGLWVHVMPGECFGLLGVNGAGKSTTFKVLTGEILPDEGDARIAGHSILLDLQQARQQLGYCPQADALPGDMTGREVLSLYARLRGVPEARVAATVEELLLQLGLDVSSKPKPWGGLQGMIHGAAALVKTGGRMLSRLWPRHPGGSGIAGRGGGSSASSEALGSSGQPYLDGAAGVVGGAVGNAAPSASGAGNRFGGAGHRSERGGGSSSRRRKGNVGLTSADTACGNYSGGSRRKLALAVALVGEPRVALLDEPSTGLDPGARRAMWATLQGPHVLKAGRGVVLTSHSMEECEALCGRLAIMSQGQARCMGSVQHLKSRFGGGYMLEARLMPAQSPDEDAAPVPPAQAACSPSPSSAAGGQAMGPADLRTASSGAGAGASSSGAGAGASSVEGLLGAPGAQDASLDARACDLAQRVVAVCPGARIVESDGARLELAIPRDGGSLADLFQIMEASLEPCGVASYALSQCTLEHVFVRLAGGDTGK